jgi:type III restriction enzyme
MPGLELREYQRESLDAIGRFCDAVRSAVGRDAMRPVHDAYYAETTRDFIQVPQLPNVPYVCLRVPTGGGKTLIAAHAVGVIAKRLGHQDHPLCLWVTPSITIRDQTLRGLRDRDHPYHLALREALGVPVEVLTVEEALSVNRSMLSSSAVIVVTTIQSYRIDEEGNRKVYQDNGYLMDHFANLPGWVRGQLAEPRDRDTEKRASLALAGKRDEIAGADCHHGRSAQRPDARFVRFAGALRPARGAGTHRHPAAGSRSGPGEVREQCLARGIGAAIEARRDDQATG